jgi:signal transduction histidine kinase
VRLETALAFGDLAPVDEDHLRRALTNLACNAIEAMPEGGLLRIESGRDGDSAWISVVDDGPGVPEAIRDRLFEPFVSEGKRNGTGLGLAVVKQVAEQHGGEVRYGKADGGGAGFHLRLPLGQRDSK